MIKKLSAIGNSLGLIIERPILELLEIDKDTELEVKTDGQALVSPRRSDRRLSESPRPERSRWPGRT